MQLNGLNLVDVASVYPYYQKRNLSLDILSKCNAQEFRYIDGYGKGCFLLTQNITSENVTFTIDSLSTTLRVIQKLSLEHPDHTGGLYAYVTAEQKYTLQETIVGRNYNVTIDKSLSAYGATTIHTAAPDLTPKTLQQVIADFLPGPHSLVYSADTLTSFDVAIEGLSVTRALDLICSMYGFVWTANASTVYVWALPRGSTSGTQILPGIEDPINDVRHSVLADDISDVTVSFPIYDYCRHEPSEYYTTVALNAAQGQVVNITDKFYPAVVNSLGAVRNSALLNARAVIIRDNLLGIEDLATYVEKHHFEANAVGTAPISLSEVYGDMGQGPRSIYRSIPYPYQMTKMPPSKARYANNWIGNLTDGYFGTVPIFIVTPNYGLDGRVPPGDQVVRNLYRWDYGAPGAFVRVEWDCVNDEWIALQQEYVCPPDEDPGYETSPYDPPYPFPPE